MLATSIFYYRKIENSLYDIFQCHVEKYKQMLSIDFFSFRLCMIEKAYRLIVSCANFEVEQAWSEHYLLQKK